MTKNTARAWRKATRSNGSGACVEVAVFTDDSIGVRDSKNPAGPVLTFGTIEWDTFLAGIKQGAFDLWQGVTPH